MNTINWVLLSLAVAGICSLVFLHMRRKAFEVLEQKISELSDPYQIPEALEYFETCVYLMKLYWILPKEVGLRSIDQLHALAVMSLEKSIEKTTIEYNKTVARISHSQAHTDKNRTANMNSYVLRSRDLTILNEKLQKLQSLRFVSRQQFTPSQVVETTVFMK